MEAEIRTANIFPVPQREETTMSEALPEDYERAKPGAVANGTVDRILTGVRVAVDDRPEAYKTAISDIRRSWLDGRISAGEAERRMNEAEVEHIDSRDHAGALS